MQKKAKIYSNCSENNLNLFNLKGWGYSHPFYFIIMVIPRKKMFDLSKVKDKELTKENVLNEVHEKVIFEYYFGSEINLTDSYVNPLREDNNPGCKFFIGKNRKLLFIDFAKRNSVVDCFGFICLKYNCNLYTALKIINKDFRLGLGTEIERGYKDSVYEYTKPSLEFFEQNKEKKSELQCLKRKYENYDYDYWTNDYGISKETLEKYNVFCVSTVFKNGKPIWRNTKENPIYAYYFPNENKKKIYRPKEKDKKYKFLSSAGMSKLYQGFDQLPEKGDLLIITKSMKDVMVLHEFGYNAIAPNGEGYDIDENFYDSLTDRFDNIIFLYDNDLPGTNAVINLSSKFQCGFISIPKDPFYTKDISDYYYNYGDITTGKLLFNLIGL